MNQGVKKYDEKDGLIFLGKITASISHEVNNVNAIIRELAGLMDDLLYGAEQTGQINVEKFREIVNKILDQTKRGERNIKRLNRFSHSVDYPKTVFKLNDIIHDIAELSRRFARLKHVTLAVDLPDETCDMNSNPFLLQYAVFMCIDVFVNSSDDYGSVNITITSNSEAADIIITGKIRKEDEKNPERINTINLLVNELHGDFIQLKNDESNDVLTLKIPLNTG
ncbi:hypothetical protein ACFL6G_00395 [candidate division KSB1 bacterium]